MTTIRWPMQADFETADPTAFKFLSLTDHFGRCCGGWIVERLLESIALVYGFRLRFWSEGYGFCAKLSFCVSGI